jgi:hypothetical protein
MVATNLPISQPRISRRLLRLGYGGGDGRVAVRSPMDYERLISQIVRFFEGQSFRTVYVLLVPAAGWAASHASRTFTVALQRGPAALRSVLSHVSW